MPMNRKSVSIIAPCPLGRDAEFFLQLTPPHTIACYENIHSVVELLYVRSGSYSVEMNNTKCNISAGDLILFCSNVPHYAVSGDDEDNSYYVLKIPPSFLLEMSDWERRAEYVTRFAIPRPENKCIWRREELEGSRILHVLEEMISEHESRGYAYEVAITLKLSELLFEILREKPIDNASQHPEVAKLIYDAILYVGEHYSEDISERKLASSLGLSYSYFSRCFKQVTGVSFKQHLNRERVNRAEQMLVLGKKTVTEVAGECGYNTVSYFINTYRSIKGKTPYDTIRAQRENNPKEYFCK